jgi:glycosyltransferase involved in cell wall biosynthesis
MTGPGALEVLVVGWYPAADDSFAGRFVADQVAALAATGQVRPTVAAFDNHPLGGDGLLRQAEDAAIDIAVERAVARHGGTLPEGAFGAPSVPVARLGIGAGVVPILGPGHGEIHRRRSLLAYVRASRVGWRLVHGHVGYPEGAAAAAAAAALGVPFVLTEHATFLATFFADPVLRKRYLATARAAAAIMPVSRMLGAELVAEFPELGPKIIPIPNTVSIDDFRAVSVADRRPDELLWVGYRKDVKGTGTLLKAFREVHERRPGLRLRLVGRSSTEQEEAGWRRLAGELGIADDVIFDGPADRSAVAEAMERATLFVHPSTRETFGVVAVEALSTGLPVVACDSGGVTEVLGADPAMHGALVPHSDPRALASAIMATLDRREGFDAAAMRASVAARYGSRAVAQRIIDVYRDAVDRAAPAIHGLRGAPREIDRGRTVGHSALTAPSVEPVAPEPRYLIVGFQRTVLDRYLAAVPRWVLENADVVTTGGELEIAGISRTTVAPAGTDRRVVELVRWGLPPTGPQPLLWRTRRVAFWPLRQVRRTRRRRWLERGLIDALRHTLDSAIESTRSDGRPVLLVCITGLDHLVARAVADRGAATIAQGGLRWLADARWVRERPPRPPSLAQD